MLVFPQFVLLAAKSSRRGSTRRRLLQKAGSDITGGFGGFGAGRGRDSTENSSSSRVSDVLRSHFMGPGREVGGLEGGKSLYSVSCGRRGDGSNWHGSL